MAERNTTSTTITTVRHIAVPMGRDRQNGPHLRDFREFVRLCEGLPNDAFVRIENGHLDEGGRQNVTISLTWKHPDDEQKEPALEQREERDL